MSKKIILVGNGPILKPLGSDIDKFDRVLRFNKFVVDGFEEGVGTKTTDWVSKSRPIMRLFKNKNRIFNSSRNHLERVYIRLLLGELISSSACAMGRLGLAPGSVFGFYRHRFDQVVYPECATDLDRELVIWPDRALIDEFLNSISSQPGKHPTIGLFGIVLALTIYKFRPIPIVCFGPRDEFVNTWYFKKEHVHVAHAFDAERVLINRWEERGLLTRIDA